MREKAVVSGSGGKDSALALYEVAGDYDVVALLTTVTSEFDRISMHGVRTALLERQAAELGFAGRVYDEFLLAGLPASADPCGENGEFHTFVFDGPNFARPVPYTLGEYTLREGRFGSRDLLPP